MLVVSECSRSENSAYLQDFLNICKQHGTLRIAFTRQRSLVRSQHRPLRENAVLQVKRGANEEAGRSTGLFFTPSSDVGFRGFCVARAVRVPMLGSKREQRGASVAEVAEA
ncbi:hypothetical protein Rxyl_2270 [Rubrobacter xylanophilus DSM 9941]|uniref:Uncharacterized protein n=1 Tax=Rubrobacter xylanophilus (strain DSM 9941 / JCM 11954 / NBRC 16129 / PRD-1) TaxID=266117 RepID=Q1ATS8_RUBXD|nr:hypothetical protein Rxyl_2270 [Rubrobacter xylanophilus DSM 9941]